MRIKRVSVSTLTTISYYTASQHTGLVCVCVFSNKNSHLWGGDTKVTDCVWQIHLDCESCIQGQNLCFYCAYIFILTSSFHEHTEPKIHLQTCKERPAKHTHTHTHSHKRTHSEQLRKDGSHCLVRVIYLTLANLIKRGAKTVLWPSKSTVWWHQTGAKQEKGSVISNFTLHTLQDVPAFLLLFAQIWLYYIV